MHKTIHLIKLFTCKSVSMKYPKSMISTTRVEEMTLSMKSTISLYEKAQHITAFRCQKKTYVFQRLPMGLAVSPSFLQYVLQEILQPVQQQATLAWVHVDDFLVAAPPHKIEQLRDVLLRRLSIAGFHINTKKSQLTPTEEIEYLGLKIDFHRRGFAPSDEHVRTLLRLEQMKNQPFSRRQQASIRGFCVFLLSTAIRQYSLVNLPVQLLLRLMKALFRLTQFTVALQPLRKPPEVHVDATPWSIALYDTESHLAVNIPSQQHQAHNELKAPLLAVLLYGNTRQYVTDCIASLCLQKRSAYAFTIKSMVASVNPRIRFIPSARNLADRPSRGQFGAYYVCPRTMLPLYPDC